MLLNDIGTVSDTKFRKINHYLETNYGFKLAEDIDGRDLAIIVEQIQSEITQLKIQGGDAKESPEISKRLMILEGIKFLKEEFNTVQFYHQPEFESVVKNLSRYVNDSVKIGDDIDDAVRQAMKEYRSSRYRFPDEVVEEKVRANCMGQFQTSIPQGAPSGVPTSGVMEEDEQEASAEDEDMKESDIEEGKKWIKTDPNKAGMFKGRSSADLEHQKANLKKRDAAHPGEVPEKDKTKMHQLNFALRAKHHDLEEDDPWGSVGKRASAMGGHAAQVPDTAQARHAMKKLDNPTLALEPQHKATGGSSQVPMVRNPHTGEMQADPFAAQKTARGTTGISMKESGNLVKHLRALLETEVSQAEVMMAAKGFAQELQEMVEKIGRLQNEDLPPVTDQMRETYGMESASAFQTQIYGALQSVMDSLYTAKQQVDDAVGNMAETGQFSASVDMDKDIGMGGMEPPVDTGDDLGADLDLDNLGDELEAEPADEFGGAESEEPLGRSKKMESSQLLKKKIAEMKKIVDKAKRLTESKVSEGSAHGHNVVKWYEKWGDQLKLVNWLRKEAGLPKTAPIYFDDADLVYGDKTILANALGNPKLKLNDLLTALAQASGTNPKMDKGGFYR